MKKKTYADLERELALVRQERDQLRALLGESPVRLCMMHGPEHTFTYVNSAWQQVYGDHPVIGLSLREAFPAMADSSAHATLDAVFGSGEPVTLHEVEAKVDRPGQPGLTSFNNILVVPLRDAEGNVTGVASMGMEVTEQVARRKQIEFLFEEVRRQADLLNQWSLEAPSGARLSVGAERVAEGALAKRIIQEVPAGIALLDRRLVFQWANPTFCTLFRLPPEALSGRSLVEAFPLAPALLGPEMAALLADGHGFQVAGVPLVTRHRDQEARTYWDIQCRPTSGAPGQTEGVMLFATDVTARVENERLQLAELAMMREADLAKGKLMDMVNYELRAPLHVLMGFGSILRKELSGELSKRQHAYLAKMLGAADALASVVDEVMTLSQLKAGVFGLFPRPVEIDDVIEQAVDEMRDVMTEKGIDFVLALEPALPPVFVEFGRLYQAVRHLLDHALTYTPHGGTVRVRATFDTETLRVEVEDSGPGIPEADQPRVFEPFAHVRAHAGRRQGVGLGLAIAHGIAEAHGGSLTLVSSASGVCFRMTLPTIDSGRYQAATRTFS